MKSNEQKNNNKQYMRLYRQSSEGRMIQKKYQKTLKYKQYQKEYRRTINGRRINCSASNAYRAKKLKRTPIWLSEKDKLLMRAIYDLAAKLGMVVDHYYPLCGKTVSGLHCPQNLQILTCEENKKKANKYPSHPMRMINIDVLLPEIG